MAFASTEARLVVNVGSTRTASTASGAEARRVARWSCFLVLDLAFNRFVDLSLIFFGGII